MLYSLVLGIDAGHLEQFRLSWPTWVANKPGLTQAPLVIFYDRHSVAPDHIETTLLETAEATQRGPTSVNFVPWPPEGMTSRDYGDPYAPNASKWTNPQRVMMLSGFVYVPSEFVHTRYWLKLDLDAVATGVDDWIDKSWFNDNPAIVSHPWGYTKPPNQMLDLDRWAWDTRLKWNMPPLNLVPLPGSSMLKHKRIISWCAFFRTSFTAVAATYASLTCHKGRLPVPSQDGYLWYCATRLAEPIVTANMKRRGWEHHNGNVNVSQAARRALGK